MKINVSLFIKRVYQKTIKQKTLSGLLCFDLLAGYNDIRDNQMFMILRQNKNEQFGMQYGCVEG
ncbi:MAG: hypothetical protein A2845_00825 [Candidatus Lloydbacteria bacterium RIFCSPHIGHO2_01_FULL_49_22]|uniref:Uncharacterized protein n=1 Tax=Candidatus Lloydbacteria bacterium RIFCSPHIGHO2_01_FULL_49_22 TaxID=1798658 RepID=A0A1G2CYI4_9BACT|nr:MAG: hypothetical protein A2845_00825 [Candidatus Lloydbacteria bacterium RIFCSPHIGHO2_01_FULL_49_22]OGZ09398.1 MAG: hypothetical protein A3C14_05730 [Candidatus Lloydbacteria bacterium RIFCSPHIGHO2_02_FULL_50_18]